MYVSRHKYLADSTKALHFICAPRGKAQVWLVWILAVMLLISAGITYRVLASHLKFVGDTPILLPIPLSDFPETVGNWRGKYLSIATTTKEYMRRNFADDFLSLRYTNSKAGVWVDVYVVYCSSRPGGILGHQPLVCYPAHGWISDGSERSQFGTLSGRQVPCLIHRFHRPGLGYDQTVVLNFYVVNGQIATDENVFSGPLGRMPNIAGDPARYVAQVQISSTLESSIRAAARDMTDSILEFFPDSDGKVKATESIDSENAVIR